MTTRVTRANRAEDGYDDGHCVSSGVSQKAPGMTDALTPREQYAHMCRDDHPQVGHNDSEHECCPVCRERDRADRAESNLAAERQARETLEHNHVAAYSEAMVALQAESQARVRLGQTIEELATRWCDNAGRLPLLDRDSRYEHDHRDTLVQMWQHCALELRALLPGAGEQP